MTGNGMNGGAAGALAAQRRREKREAEEAIAARTAQLAEVRRNGGTDEDLATLIGEARTELAQGHYWTAKMLMSEDSLAHQRSL